MISVAAPTLRKNPYGESIAYGQGLIAAARICRFSAAFHSESAEKARHS
jgi:hypothetical protein